MKLGDRFGQKFRFRGIEFYAWEGVIAVEDLGDRLLIGRPTPPEAESDSEICMPNGRPVKTVSPFEFRDRARQLESMISASVDRNLDAAAQRDIVRECKQAAADMRTAVKEAIAMGSPYDAAAVVWHSKHRPQPRVTSVAGQGGARISRPPLPVLGFLAGSPAVSSQDFQEGDEVQERMRLLDDSDWQPPVKLDDLANNLVVCGDK